LEFVFFVASIIVAASPAQLDVACAELVVESVHFAVLEEKFLSDIDGLIKYLNTKATNRKITLQRLCNLQGIIL